MKPGAATILVWLAVAGAWLGTLGFLRLRQPLDRLHCVSFVNVVGGTALLLAAVLQDGLSDRVLKVALLWFVALVSGAVLAHATGRALQAREREP